MKFPNKIFSYRESVLYAIEIILEELQNSNSITCLDLYERTKNEISFINDWIDAMDCLYALDVIVINPTSKEIIYALPN